jgi:hypothetical protein
LHLKDLAIFQGDECFHVHSFYVPVL